MPASNTGPTLDPGDRCGDILDDILPHVDILLPNKCEAMKMSLAYGNLCGAFSTTATPPSRKKVERRTSPPGLGSL